MVMARRSELALDLPNTGSLISSGMNQISPSEPIDLDPIDLSVEGMTCAGCVQRVQGALSAVPGVASASVNLANRRARVSGSAPLDALLQAVDAVGYHAQPAPKDAAGEAAEE